MTIIVKLPGELGNRSPHIEVEGASRGLADIYVDEHWKEICLMFRDSERASTEVAAEAVRFLREKNIAASVGVAAKDIVVIHPAQLPDALRLFGFDDANSEKVNRYAQEKVGVASGERRGPAISTEILRQRGTGQPKSYRG